MPKPIIAVAVLAALAAGCASQEAKVLSAELVAGQELYAKRTAALRDQVVALADRAVAKALEAKGRELDAVGERYRARLVAAVDDAYFNGLDEGRAALAQAAATQLRSAADDAAKNRVNLFRYASEAKLVEAATARRRAAVDRGSARIDAQVAESKRQLDALSGELPALRTRAAEAMNQLVEYQGQLTDGQRRLDAHLRSQSEVTLALSGFLRAFGITVDPSRIEAAVGAATEGVERRAGEIIDRADQRLTAVLDNAAAPDKTAGKANGTARAPAGPAGA